MSRNLPNDWNEYWRGCPDCGARYHASEGCECWDRDEDADDEDTNEEDTDDDHEAADA